MKGVSDFSIAKLVKIINNSKSVYIFCDMQKACHDVSVKSVTCCYIAFYVKMIVKILQPIVFTFFKK